jgi:hypothetical protein
MEKLTLHQIAIVRALVLEKLSQINEARLGKYVNLSDLNAIVQIAGRVLKEQGEDE